MPGANISGVRPGGFCPRYGPRSSGNRGADVSAPLARSNAFIGASAFSSATLNADWPIVVRALIGAPFARSHAAASARPLSTAKWRGVQP
jgi:hypothetical protein